MLKKISPKKSLSISALLFLFVVILFFGTKYVIHNRKINQLSSKQCDLYQNTLIPTLVNGFEDYKILHFSCKEIDTKNICDYAIQMDCTLRIGTKDFNYPVNVLFYENDINNPKYQYSTEATNDIIDEINSQSIEEYNYTLECKLIDFQVIRPAGEKYLSTLHRNEHKENLRSSFTNQLWTDYDIKTDTLTIHDRIDNKGKKLNVEKEIEDEYLLVKDIQINNNLGSPSNIIINVYETDGNFNILKTLATYKNGTFIINGL